MSGKSKDVSRFLKEKAKEYKTLKDLVDNSTFHENPSSEKKSYLDLP